MGRLLVFLGLVITCLPSRGEAAPSWFSFKSDSVQVHVCNELVIGKERSTLSEFAPQVADDGTRLLAMPIKTTGLFLDSKCTLWAQVGKKRYKMRAAEWVDKPMAGTCFTIAVFVADFRLKDVTGFTLETPRKAFTLTQESKLR